MGEHFIDLPNWITDIILSMVLLWQPCKVLDSEAANSCNQAEIVSRNRSPEKPGRDRQNDDSLKRLRGTITKLRPLTC